MASPDFRPDPARMQIHQSLRQIRCTTAEIRAALEHSRKLIRESQATLVEVDDAVRHVWARGVRARLRK